MNLNDLRRNAYAPASENKSDKKTPGSASSARPFVPPRVERNSASSAGKTDNGKPLFSGVNREMNDIFTQSKKLSKQTATADDVKAATDSLTSGGLLKVPVEKPEADGSDSVYRRVAKFLLLIGVDEAAKILPHLTEEQTEKIIPEIASIRSVSSDEASVILAEFQGLMQKARDTGGVDTAREILEKAFGEKKAEQMLNNAVQYPEGKPFEYLNDADSERIFMLLKDESAAIRSLVLSRIDPKKAAAVINQMNADDKKDVILRLAKMQPIAPDVIRRVDHAMHEKSLAQTVEKAEVVDGRNALAAILKKMSPTAEDEILGSLSDDDPDLGQDLRSRLFTIDDVVNSDDRFIQGRLQLMADVDIAFLIAGKPDDFRAKILHNVSAGRGDTILEEEQLHKPMRRADCDKITAQFFSILRRAYEDGKLIIKGRSDDVYV